MIKLKFHSIVDVITNSSTVIYTYQNSIKQAKELVDEMLKLAGINNKTADDIFYYGVFHKDGLYFDFIENNSEDIEGVPQLIDEYGTEEYYSQKKELSTWFDNLKISIMKGIIEQPEWMSGVKDSRDWKPKSYLNLIPKEEKYKVFGEKIKALLSSVSADGGSDG